jgi:molybdenum-dependent DNA-binding transcriptional regulator ModE
MLGVGGTRQKLGRDALRGGDRGGRAGGGADPQARKRDLLRKFQERQRRQREEARASDPSS